MNNPFQKGIREHQSMNLSASERNSIKDSLISFMQFHPAKPVMDKDLTRLHEQGSILTIFNLHYKKAMSIALIIALMLSGSVSFAAESALPGDVLYPVKVNINEKARGLVKLDAESKAEWEASLSDRRLDEAEKLALSGDLKADLATNLEDRFEAHAENAEARIDKLEAAGKTEAATKLRGALDARMEAHEKVIAAITASSTVAEKNNGTLVALGVLLNNRLRGDKVVLGLSGPVETAMVSEKKDVKDDGRGMSIGVMEQAQIKMKVALEKIASAKKLIESKKDSLTAEGYVKAQAQLSEADKVYVEAQSAFAADDYPLALKNALSSMHIAGKAEAAVEIFLRLDKRINFRTIINGNATSSDNNGRGNDRIEGALNLDLVL